MPNWLQSLTLLLGTWAAPVDQILLLVRSVALQFGGTELDEAELHRLLYKNTTSYFELTFPDGN